MNSLAPRKLIWIVVVLCLACGISAHAQTLTYGQLKAVSGGNPTTAPVQGLNGDLYGTTGSGGTSGFGAIYKLSPDGSYSKIYDFCSQTNCTDGKFPQGLILAANGNFYGLTGGGGTNNGAGCNNDGCGTVFELTPAGQLITLYNFCSLANCADGALPFGSLVQGINGNFYGTTFYGGIRCPTCGTVFEITAAGQFTTLHSFCSHCNDGYQPEAGLMLASDGNFYGTTTQGGPGNWGIVFKMTPWGAGSVLHLFCSQTNCDDGWGQLRL